MNDVEHRDVSSLIWPIAIIAIGLFFLLRNLGWLTFSVWPLVIIALGIAVIVKSLRSVGEGTARPAVREYECPLEDMKSAFIEVENGFGDLRVEGPGGEDVLIAGEFDTKTSPLLEKRNGTARIRLPRWGEGFRFWQMFGDRRVWLTPRIPLTLRLSHWFGDVRADLESLKVRSLYVSHGFGDVKITFPRQGETKASINSMAGDVTLYIPQGIAARISALPVVLGKIRLDQSVFRPSDGSYVTDGYEVAEDRIDIRLGSHLGDIRVHRV